MMFRRILTALTLLAGVPAAAAVPAGYILGPDDTIQVVVYGQQDAGVTTRIKSDGTIVMPLIGTIHVAGENNIALADTIGKKLSSAGFFKSPIVNVEIASYVSRRANVAGRVAQPGVFPLDRDYHTLELLLKAGWTRDNGANYVFLRHADGREQRLETDALSRGGEKDPLIVPGDTIFVPDADNFYIYGQINRPGTFPVIAGLTVRQALAIAGGVTATGSDRKVQLIHPGGKDGDAGLDDPVGKNDVLVVKERLF